MATETHGEQSSHFRLGAAPLWAGHPKQRDVTGPFLSPTPAIALSSRAEVYEQRGKARLSGTSGFQLAATILRNGKEKKKEERRRSTSFSMVSSMAFAHYSLPESCLRPHLPLGLLSVSSHER